MFLEYFSKIFIIFVFGTMPMHGIMGMCGMGIIPNGVCLKNGAGRGVFVYIYIRGEPGPRQESYDLILAEE